MDSYKKHKETFVVLEMTELECTWLHEKMKALAVHTCDNETLRLSRAFANATNIQLIEDQEV